jgi:hypothetical protein
MLAAISISMNSQLVFAETTVSDNVSIAQATHLAPVPNIIPTDVTNIGIGRERSLVDPGWRYHVLNKLPERLWFSMSTEVSQRLDTNVLFTYSHPKADYAFRVLPNIFLGYDLWKRSSIYTNYFVIKDLFASQGGLLNFPTTQSLSLGFRQEFPITQRTNIQLDFQARELWQTANIRQADLLPSILVTHMFTPRMLVFGNSVLQLRGSDYFCGPQREIDPFYTLGLVYRKGQWVFTATQTLVNNYRRRNAIPPVGNVSLIGDLEVSHPIHRKIPGLVGFVRAEPIYNWRSQKVAGISGFDFRLFGGLRFSMNKPSYSPSINQLKRQLIESESQNLPNSKEDPNANNQSNNDNSPGLRPEISQSKNPV